MNPDKHYTSAELRAEDQPGGDRRQTAGDPVDMAGLGIVLLSMDRSFPRPSILAGAETALLATNTNRTSAFFVKIFYISITKQLA